MDMEFVTPNGEFEMKNIPNEEISEFRLKQVLLKGCEIALLTKFTIGKTTIPFGNLTIENKSNIREGNGALYADLLFDYDEYQDFEEHGEVFHMNGMKLLRLPVTIQKEHILGAGVIPKNT